MSKTIVAYAASESLFCRKHYRKQFGIGKSWYGLTTMCGIKLETYKIGITGQRLCVRCNEMKRRKALV